MIDQKKTGLFIAEVRKAKGLTQKQLADEIGVSDKAVSRWETGRGMPDTLIMPELCRTLEININELLSGERLSEDAYNGKAEEHMVELIKNNENEKRAGKHTLISLIIGLIITLLFVAFIMFSSGGSRFFYFYWDSPTIISVFGLQFIILGIAGQFGDFFKGFKVAFAPGKFNPELLIAQAEKSEQAISYGIKALLLSGTLSISIEIVSVGYYWPSTDLVALGPSIAIIALSAFYPVLGALIMYAIKGRIHKVTS
ncbi:MAG: helix-turn-helix transcriptional regulator [Lachnospiraceae bacterium]|nr:helix-turn-helix transcriptional regulator [Lachnospiraceae bacterium]